MELAEDVKEFLDKYIAGKFIYDVPIEVERKIAKFCQSMEGSQRVMYMNNHKKAYLEMMEYIEEAKIPEEEKNGILRNVSSMYPNNYIMQKMKL